MVQQINIGLDFGTHQTKVCAETKSQIFKQYTFLDFVDHEGEVKYVLPSLIKINPNGKLEYGFIDNHTPGTIVRYFKQATFTNASEWHQSISPVKFSIWYIAFILFKILNKFDYDKIAMGVPTDSAHFDYNKQLAVRIIASAYRLVDVVFGNDEKAFLNATLQELEEKTEILGYSKDLKNNNGVMVYPEAYACIKPLLAHGRLKAPSMNLMVDIGGGTTDISFFSLDTSKKKVDPRIYLFYSIPKGLNFLTDYGIHLEDGFTTKSANAILSHRQRDLESSVSGIYDRIYQALRSEFFKYRYADDNMFKSGLRNRPVIFTGGGSTFNRLRKSYGMFSDVRLVSMKDWMLEHVERIPNMESLCPILSTAYGLSISETSDDIKPYNLKELFSWMKNYVPESKEPSTPQSRSYHDDWRYKEYGVLDYSGSSRSSTSSYSTKNRTKSDRLKFSESASALQLQNELKKKNNGLLPSQVILNRRKETQTTRKVQSKAATINPPLPPQEINSIEDVAAFLRCYTQLKKKIKEKSISKRAKMIRNTVLRNEFIQRCNEFNSSFI